MGGASGAYFRELLNDAFVLDIEVDRMQKVVEEGPLKFMSHKNSSVSIEGNSVVALVYG